MSAVTKATVHQDNKDHVTATQDKDLEDHNVTAADHEAVDPESEVVRWNVKVPRKFQRQKLGAKHTFLATLRKQYQVDVTYNSATQQIFFRGLKEKVKCCHDQVKDEVKVWRARNEQLQKQADEKMAAGNNTKAAGNKNNATKNKGNDTVNKNKSTRNKGNF